ncbi:MAG: hypothetical protein LBQ62_05770 [Candidatus Accumulibacter sp.]|jgi:hypothetical protein|nr:hypothetical protein [Accumulibacter sp.]
MQGYLTLATGSRLYLEIALNLALSLKLNDPARPLCLVTDAGMDIPDTYRPFFDRIVILSPRPGFHGCLDKLRTNEVSPYDETMFIDSDCLLIKNDMDRHWTKFSGNGFMIAGGKQTQGHWYNFSISDAIEKLDIPYMVQMNSGVFYFRKGAEADLFFRTALELVEQHKELLGSRHRNRLQLADEPFIGAALGKLIIEPIGYDPAEGSIMITTVRSSKESFDPFMHTSQIVKHSDFRILGRFFPGTSVRHSPSLAHFVKLRPRNLYNRLSDALRRHYNLESMRFR